VSDPGKAVFLSYASQDAAEAKRIADALRAAGVEVWFDQNELVGGDAWDAKIRKQIAECALFVPVISANTQARLEGYFRLEWKIAAQRTHTMADERVFLLPVVLDDTRDTDAKVPVEFKAVQWTRLPGGPATGAFGERVKKILATGADVVGVSPPRAAAADPAATVRLPDRRRYAWVAVGIVFALIYAVRPLWREKEDGKVMPKAQAGQSAALSEAQKLERQARALVDVEPLAVRETFRTAYQLCEKAAALSPGEAEVWATMARANVMLIGLYQEGGTERAAAARSQAEKALSLAPDSVEAGLAMAAVELELLAVDPLAVRARLEALLRQAPGDHRIPLLLAQTEDGDTVTATAFRWLAQAEAIPAGKAAAALRQAWIFWGANRLRECLEAVDRSLAAQPLSEAYHLKLMLLKTMGETEAAQAWLKRIPSVVLREDRAAMIAYETLYFARKPEEALRVLQALPREVLEEGRFFDVRALLAAEALLMAGKNNAAQVELRAALKVIDERLATNPRHGRLWHAKGRAQNYLGDRAGAERSFATAAELGGLREIELAAQAILMGRTDDTLALIDRTLNRQLTRWPSWLHYFKLHPVFDPLRANPRYQQLLARAEAWLAEDLRRPPAGSSASAAPHLEAPKAEDKSVAVLAFANLSDDKNNEYFSDGISEELLNVLAKVPGLKVSARTSAFYFKGKEVPVPEIAKQLGVAYVVEGSVRKSGDKVRITAQLIKAADGFHVWSDTFTRDLKDIFAVQDEIAGLIAQQLQLKLGDTSRATKVVNPEAHRLVLEGWHFWNLRTEEGFARAEAAFKQALVIDPQFAQAHAGLAHDYVIRAQYRLLDGIGGAVEDWALGRAEAQKAIDLDPMQAEPYVALAYALANEGRWKDTEQLFQKAFALNPNYAMAHLWHSQVLASQGRLDLSLEEHRRAIELDPLSFIIVDRFAEVLRMGRQFSEALDANRRAADLRREIFIPNLGERVMLLLELGHQAEAGEVARAIRQASTLRTRWNSDSYALLALERAGLKQEAADYAAQLISKLPEDNYARGFVLVALGRFGDALPSLEHSPPISRRRLFWDMLFDPWREDPRFLQLMVKLGCVEEYKVARETLARMLKEQAGKK